MTRKISFLLDAEDDASDDIRELKRALSELGRESSETSADLSSITSGASVAVGSLEAVEEAAEDADAELEDISGKELSFGGMLRGLTDTVESSDILGGGIESDELRESVFRLREAFTDFEVISDEFDDEIVGFSDSIENAEIQTAEFAEILEQTGEIELAEDLRKVREEFDALERINLDALIEGEEIRETNLSEFIEQFDEFDSSAQEVAESADDVGDSLDGIAKSISTASEKTDDLNESTKDVASGYHDIRAAAVQTREEIEESSDLLSATKSKFKLDRLQQDTFVDPRAEQRLALSGVKTPLSEIPKVETDPFKGTEFAPLEDLPDIANPKEQLNEMMGEVEEGVSGAEMAKEFRRDPSEIGEGISATERVVPKIRDTGAKKPGPIGSEPEKMAQAFRKVSDAQEDLAHIASTTDEIVGMEASSFAQAASKADDLAGMKEAASGANRDLALKASRTEAAVLDEMGAIRQLSAISDDTEETLRRLADSDSKLAATASNTLDRLDDLDEEHRKNAAAALINAAAQFDTSEGIDEVGDEAEDASEEVADLAKDMTAGALAAEFFSGEFGSLSLNLGAVNVALRNMTRQVPFLITTIGTLVSIVGGLASVAVTAGTALGGIFAAGVIAQARSFAENIAEVKNTTQGIKAVMANVKDLFAEAANPLIQAQGTIDFFVGTIEGLAQEVNVVARTIRNMMNRFLEFGKVVGDILDQGFNEFVQVMANSFVQLEDELIGIVEFFAFSLPDAIEFFTNITDKMGDIIGNLINQFTKFSAELIKLGSSIQAGALPVVTDFITALTSLVEGINELGSANIAAAGAFAATAIVGTKVIETLSAITLVGASAANSIMGIAGSASQASTAIGGMGIVVSEVGESLGDLVTGADNDRFDKTQRVIKNLSDSFDGLSRKIVASQGPTSRLGKFFMDLEMQGLRAALANTTLGTALTGVATSAKSAMISVYAYIKSLLTNIATTIVTSNTAFILGGALLTVAGAFTTAAAAVYSFVSGLAVDIAAKITATGAGAALAGMMAIVGGAFASAAAAVQLFIGVLLSIPVLGQLLGVITAIIGAGAVLVGIIGNIDAVSSGVNSTLNALTSIFKDIAGFLLSIFIPAWNMLVDIFEVALIPFELVFALIEGLMNMLFDTGGKSPLMVVFDSLIESVMFARDLLVDLFEFVSFLANELVSAVNKLPNVNIDMSGAKVSKEDISNQTEGDASGKVPSDKQNKFEFNKKNVSNNYGDVNADPKEKQAMKRLVKEAMMEANTFRRQDDGFSG